MTDVVMPQMGESIVEGTLTKWLKKPGEHVERDEPLFEISTDKVDTEIPSPAAGTLAEVLVEEGKTVGINTVVARIEESGGGAAAAEASPQAARKQRIRPHRPRLLESTARAATANQRQAGRACRCGPCAGRARAAARAGSCRAAGADGPLSPLVRKMAREFNIDLSQVRGTGAGGRITKQDVEAYMARQGRTAQQPVPAPSAAGPPSAPPQQTAPPQAPPRRLRQCPPAAGRAA